MHSHSMRLSMKEEPRDSLRDWPSDSESESWQLNLKNPIYSVSMDFATIYIALHVKLSPDIWILTFRKERQLQETQQTIDAAVNWAHVFNKWTGRASELWPLWGFRTGVDYSSHSREISLSVTLALRWCKMPWQPTAKTSRWTSLLRICMHSWWTEGTIIESLTQAYSGWSC